MVAVHPQPGIFALGTIEHSYVEFDLAPGADPAALVAALAALTGPETTIGGVNAVIGFRPELWARVAPDEATPRVRSFGEDIVGPDGNRMPSTQHDAWLWIAGGARDVVFDSTLTVVRRLAGLATMASEVNGWLYRHDRDLTGFIDGTENPSMIEAPDVAVVPEGKGAGASILLVQQWRHLQTFETLSEPEQEKVIGRTKPDSVELDEHAMPADSHVSRTAVEFGGRELQIYRRNTAYGSPTDYGTMFVAFCAEQRPFEVMLRSMAGLGDGVRDALTRHTTPLTGAYYVIPSLRALARFAPDQAPAEDAAAPSSGS
jgi:putative iron-dependent peroxidase